MSRLKQSILLIVIGVIGGSASITIRPALDKLAEPIASGGAATDLSGDNPYKKWNGQGGGSASVVISPDEKTMQVSIRDTLGRNVMTASMTGPADATPNQLINWTCTQYDVKDTTTLAYETLKTTTVDPDGNTTFSLADGFGQTVASVDQLGHQSNSVFDSGGRMLTSTNALNKSTTYTYDDLGRQLTVTIVICGKFAR
jgi:YD repeat-containing protein